MEAMNKKPYSWKFFRAGGFYQVKLESGADLAHLDELDQKLWVALACPTHGLEIDSRTLELIDTDGNKRIRPPEIIAAAKWAISLLKNPDQLLLGTPSLPLDAINDATPEGKSILDTARQFLGAPDAKEIALAAFGKTERTSPVSFNGDGIIPTDAADNAATKAVIEDIIACAGGVTDRSGKPGINQEMVDAFFADAEAYSNGWKHVEIDKSILPLGDATGAASDAVNAVTAKANDFFARCRVAAFDGRAVPVLNHQAWEYLQVTTKDLSATATEVSGFPLAQVGPGKALPLAGGVNPAWADALAALQTSAVKPLLGDKDSLTEADWGTLQAKLAPFIKWSSDQPGASVKKLGPARVREILAGKSKDEITALIAKDTNDPITGVERLIRYHRDLYKLCLNFVNFKEFYSRQEPAIFQAGRLYLDHRSYDLCLTVEDTAKHAMLAGLAGAYLAYLNCTRQPTGEKIGIVAVVSQGDDGNLMVGRNGVFYDRKGNDYDATITQIISNPISVRQAIWSPYKKLVRFIQEQAAKRAAAAESAATTSLQSATTAGAAGAAKSKFDTGTLAAISLVLTGLLGALSVIFSKLFGLQPEWEIPLAILGILVAISIPSVVTAWLKLRERNLGPILDANGWAVNARAKLSVPFGASLTQIAKLPPGSQRDPRDPYEHRTRRVGIVAIVVLLVAIGLGIAWYLGKLDGALPHKMRSVIVLGTHAPAYLPPTNSIAAPTGTNDLRAK